jgi:hypothetical protein
MSRSYQLTSIKQLLEFDANSEDIFSIQGRMRALNEFFKTGKDYAALQDFIKVYLLVTERVVDSRFGQEKYFTNIKKLNELDVHFCKYYFNAVAGFLLTGSTKTPWINTFKYSNESNMPFTNVLMGINSHINGDLAVSLLDVNFSSKTDFDKVNSILYAVIPSLLSYLAIERMDFVGVVGLVARNFVEAEFNKLIVQWRSDAYNNYQLLKKSDNVLMDKKIIKDKTETVSENIYNMLERELRSPITLIEQLNELKVKL